MQLSRPSNMQHLALSKFTGLTSLYLGPLIKSFLKTLILMICRSPVTICLWCLSAKGELLHLHGQKIYCTYFEVVSFLVKDVKACIF